MPGPFLLFLGLILGVWGELLPVIFRDQGVLEIKVGTPVCRAQLSLLSYFPSPHFSFRHFAGLGEMSVAVPPLLRGTQVDRRCNSLQLGGSWLMGIKVLVGLGTGVPSGFSLSPHLVLYSRNISKDTPGKILFLLPMLLMSTFISISLGLAYILGAYTQWH